MNARMIRFAVFAFSLGVLGTLSVRPTHAQSSEGSTKPPPAAPPQNNNPQGTTSGCCSSNNSGPSK